MIGFNNVQGFGVTKQMLMKSILDEHKFDVIALCETKRDDDHPVTEMHENYKWIGKNRTKGGGGGIGFLCSNNSIIEDDNLLNSKCDNVERLWINVMIGKVSIAIWVVHFPCDTSST